MCLLRVRRVCVGKETRSWVRSWRRLSHKRESAFSVCFSEYGSGRRGCNCRDLSPKEVDTCCLRRVARRRSVVNYEHTKELFEHSFMSGLLSQIIVDFFPHSTQPVCAKRPLMS